MLLSAETDRRSTSRYDHCDSCSEGSPMQLSVSNIKTLLGCGYVGNKDVVHISTAWACGPCG